MWLVFRRFRCRSFCRRHYRVIICVITMAAIFSTMIFVTLNGNSNGGAIYQFKRQDRKLNEYLKRTIDEKSLIDNFENSPPFESISDHGIQDHFLHQGKNLKVQISDHQRIQTLQNQLDKQKQVQQQLEQQLREINTYHKQFESEQNNPRKIDNPISLSPIPKSDNAGLNRQINQQHHQEQSQQQLLQQQQQQLQQANQQQQQRELQQQQQQLQQQQQQNLQQQNQQLRQQQLKQQQQQKQQQQNQQQQQQHQQQILHQQNREKQKKQQRQQQEEQHFQHDQQSHYTQASTRKDQETLQKELLQQQQEMLQQQQQYIQQKSLMQDQMQQQPHIQQQFSDDHIQQKQQPSYQQVQQFQQQPNIQHQSDKHVQQNQVPVYQQVQEFQNVPQNPRAQQPNVPFPNPQQLIQQNQQVQYFQQPLPQNSQQFPFNQQLPVDPQPPQLLVGPQPPHAPQPVQWQITNDQGNAQKKMPNLHVFQNNPAPSKSSNVANGFPGVIADDIAWSTDIEALTPVAYSWSEVDSWCSRVRRQPIVFMTPGDPFKCGVPPNQYAVLADGTQLCVRYRHPHTIMLHGEIYSFYLARLLDIKNIPPVVLSEIDKSGVNWQQQATKFDSIKWSAGKFVVLSQFVEDLEIEDARYPMILFERNGPIQASTSDLVTLTVSELTYLVQWTDLVILDYLVGHIDRITNHQEGSYGQTDEIKNYIYNRQSIHNLGFGRSSGILWFIDNESGFRTGYSTLYINRDIANMKKYNKFHEDTLRTICIFRRTTVQKLEELQQNPDPWNHLKNFVDSYEPLAKELKPVATHDFPVNFKQRVENVYKWMQECRQKH